MQAGRAADSAQRSYEKRSGRDAGRDLGLVGTVAAAGGAVLVAGVRYHL
jgi:hypothetical protein